MKDFINYYEILGVSKKSTEEEIKKAYREQAKKWHPDLNKDPNAGEISKKINEAKETLLNKEKREKYDIYLEEQTNLKYRKIRENKNKTTQSNSKQEKSETHEEQEKMYTKWEYFLIYLKYYQVSKKRKLLSIILVILETILCSLLQMLNYILTLILAYTGEMISYFSTIAVTIYIIYIIFANSYGKETLNISQNIIFVTLGLFFTIMPYIILPIMINIIPNKLFDLNIYLFKKAINYK